MTELSREALNILHKNKLNIKEFGKLLNQQWILKKDLNPHSTNSLIDDLYKMAINNGAYGGKITGAGAGGFLMLIAPKYKHKYLKKKPLTVVRPGTQSRRFTHIDDTIEICFKAWKENKCRFYSISNKKSYTIKQVAKMFGGKFKLIKARSGERYASALTNMSLTNKIIKRYGNIDLKDYVSSFIKV